MSYFDLEQSGHDLIEVQFQCLPERIKGNQENHKSGQLKFVPRLE
jgi:hypothetical protein